MTTYLLDVDVFIQAKNLHYGFDFCPAFWDWLEEQNNARRVFSVERVGDEILAGDDELAEWARQRLGLGHRHAHLLVDERDSGWVGPLRLRRGERFEVVEALHAELV